MSDSSALHHAVINGASPSGVVARTVEGGVAINSLSGETLSIQVVAANKVIIRPMIGTDNPALGPFEQ